MTTYGRVKLRNPAPVGLCIVRYQSPKIDVTEMKLSVAHTSTT